MLPPAVVDISSRMITHDAPMRPPHEERTGSVHSPFTGDGGPVNAYSRVWQRTEPRDKIAMTNCQNNKGGSMSKPSKAPESSNKGVDLAEIDSLIAQLAGYDGLGRQRARLTLVAIGQPALTRLEEALVDVNYLVRWEAAKALGQIRDPSTAPALVDALEDPNFGVRWLAAEALIGLRRAAFSPLLEALAERGQYILLRESAHHVLRTLCEMGLRDSAEPVLKAMEGKDPESEVPRAARKALEEQ